MSRHQPSEPQGFLLDENLPHRLAAGFEPGTPVTYARDLGNQPTDLTLWTYAKAKALVIVTKDADFMDYVLLEGGPPPWVVQLRCGNLRARELHEFLEAQWPRVLALLPEYQLLQVSTDRIEGIG